MNLGCLCSLRLCHTHYWKYTHQYLAKKGMKISKCTNIQVFSRGDIKLESLHTSTVCSISMETIIAVTTICSLSVRTGRIRVAVIARFLKTFIYICNGDLHCRRSKYRKLSFLNVTDAWSHAHNNLHFLNPFFIKL